MNTKEVMPHQRKKSNKMLIHDVCEIYQPFTPTKGRHALLEWSLTGQINCISSVPCVAILLSDRPQIFSNTSYNKLLLDPHLPLLAMV